VGDHLCAKIAEEVDIQEMQMKFKSVDQHSSGRVSVDIFQKVVGDLGFDLDDVQKGELRDQVGALLMLAPEFLEGVRPSSPC
jgi:Ca2+-binding EF-hand superfamily protein